MEHARQFDIERIIDATGDALLGIEHGQGLADG
jgi:hypothetical protein